ncbi:MAG TPA: hypothetical protein RMG48_20840 [Myxococcales bacterium LLY-WYZ-16_1]|nr:hypothetical protein [Myxococcales bacterium LLY-WYZ-16_1]
MRSAFGVWARLHHGLQVFLFLFVTSGIFVLSLPNPSKIGVRSRWETDRTRREFEAWGRPLGLDADQVDALLWPVARAVAGVTAVLRRPFQWAGDPLGFYQGWRMFSTPRTYTRALEVDVLDPNSGEFRPVYRSRSTEHRWLAEKLDQNRVRKLVGRSIVPESRGRRRYLVRWLRDNAKRSFPDSTQMRIRIVKLIPPPPEQFARGASIVREVESSRTVTLKR